MPSSDGGDSDDKERFEIACAEYNKDPQMKTKIDSKEMWAGAFFIRIARRFRINQSNRTQPPGPIHLAAAGRRGNAGRSDIPGAATVTAADP